MKTIGQLTISILTTILRGWVFTYLWLWFVVKLFNVPELNIPQALGLSVCFSMLNFKIQTNKPTEEPDYSWMIAYSISGIFVTWLMGYIIHFFL